MPWCELLASGSGLFIVSTLDVWLVSKEILWINQSEKMEQPQVSQLHKSSTLINFCIINNNKFY